MKTKRQFKAKYSIPLRYDSCTCCGAKRSPKKMQPECSCNKKGVVMECAACTKCPECCQCTQPIQVGG